MSPAEQLGRLLRRKPRLTLAVAESVTAGRIQAGVASVSGASEYFLGGITAYALRQKTRLLGVDRAHAARVNCVSQRVAVEMAVGALKCFGADLAVATTGYAEPARAHGVKVPMAWWARCHRKRGGVMAVATGFVEISGASRVAVQERVAQIVLEELVKYLKTAGG